MFRSPRTRLAFSLGLCLFLIPFTGGPVAGATPRADSGVPVAPLKCETQTQCSVDSSTDISSDFNGSHYGQSVTFTAAVTPAFVDQGTPMGTVDFSDGATALCSAAPLDVTGKATCTVSSLALGDHTINAYYGGDWAVYRPSGDSLVQAVWSTGTRTIMGSSSEISRFGQPVVFSAFVYAPLSGEIQVTGRFQFRVDGVDVGSPVTINPDGRAFLHPIANLNVGHHLVGGTFLGNRSFRPSRPVRLLQDVQPADTKTTVAVTPSGADAGETLILRATVHASLPGSGSPDGTVRFYVDGVPTGALRTVVFGHAHVTLAHGVAAGTHTFTAVYAGSDSFVGSGSPVVSKNFTRVPVPSCVLAGALRPAC